MGKAKKVMPGLVVSIFVIVTVYIVTLGTSTRILAEQTTGCGISRNEQKYWANTGVGGENGISCTKEQYENYRWDSDFGGTDTIFTVIYEQNKLIPSKQKVLKIKKFHVTWDNSIHKRIIPGVTYYRLVEESLEKVDDKHGVFSRLYERYDKDASQMRLVIENTVIGYSDDMKSAREWLLDNNKEFLRLKPMTIVDSKIIESWKEDGYSPEVEYHDKSREGLTYEGIINMENRG